MRLNVGGQQSISRFPEGWTCVDILPGADVVLDVSKDPIPCEHDRAEAIYCSHMLEHVWPWRHDFVLSEFYRVLKRGCLLRIVVPDMDIVLDLYQRHRGSPHCLRFAMSWWFDPTLDKEGNVCLNHVCGFNWPLLSRTLRKAGFRSVERKGWGDYSDIFEGCDNPGHKKTSLYVEAKK